MTALISVTMSEEDWNTLCAVLYIASVETDCNRRTKQAMEEFRVRINAALGQEAIAGPDA